MGAAGQPALSAEAQAALDGQLCEAAATGDAAAIERLAAEGASPSAKNEDGLPALYMAACNGHAGAVSALARLGADLDARSRRDGTTALMDAAFYGEVELVRVLLAGGADSSLRAAGGHRVGKTALEMAEQAGKAEVAALLRGSTM